MLEILASISKSILKKSFKTGVPRHFSNSSCFRNTEFNFKQQKNRKPRERATLKEPKYVAYLTIALVLTVAAPKLINDAVAYFDEKKDDEK